MKRLILLSSMLAAMLLAAAPAFADTEGGIFDNCSTVGDACNNAGPSYDQPGTCTAKTCNKTLPDGGSFEYPCNKCVATTATGGGGGTTNTGGKKSSDSNDDGGCSVRAERQTGGILVGLTLLGLGALALRRRRNG